VRRDRAALVGASLAAVWLVGVAALDIATAGSTVVLSVLFAVAPLIACAVLPATSTAVFAVLAVGLTVASGWWDQTWGSPQQLVRITDVVLVSVAAVLVAAVRVRREEAHERVAAIAEVAQRAVLPKLPERVAQVVTGARYLSAAEDTVVGGDLYDCYYFDGQVRFLIGDVRGKGIEAVEQAARVIRAFRQAAARQADLPAVAADMTSYLEPFFGVEEFVTALLVDVADPAALRLVSCGHPPALLVRLDGRTDLVEAPPGLPLGLSAWLGPDYTEVSVPWAPGDRLLLYTDGLSEARNGDGHFLPLVPLAGLLRSATVDEALDALLASVADYVPGGDLSDDLAVILLEHTPLNQSQPSTRAALGQHPVSLKR
jgi:phosphoserine phosphatase RsbU/P